MIRRWTLTMDPYRSKRLAGLQGDKRRLISIRTVSAESIGTEPILGLPCGKGLVNPAIRN